MGALLLKALEAAEDELYREQRAAGTEHETTAAQRRADAFGLWLEDRVQPRVQLDIGDLVPAEAHSLPEQDFGLARWHGRRGIGPPTGTTRWQGERIDWGWAMACLRGEGGEEMREAI